MRSKVLLFLFCAFLVIAFAATSVFAGNVVTAWTGTMIVITPDGVVTTVGPNDPLPPMPTGTSITVISGTITMSPESGSYSVTIGGTTATVNAGDVAECGFDSDGEVQVGSTSGTIETVTNGVTASIPAGSQAKIIVDSAGQVTVGATGDGVTVTPPGGTPQVVTPGTTSTAQGNPPEAPEGPETELEGDEVDNKDLQDDKEISPTGE